MRSGLHSQIPKYEPRSGTLGSLMSQVLRTCVEILSRLKPAKLFGNAFVFHITQAPTGACFQNLDATRRKSPVAPPSALSQAEPLSWLTLRLTTLLVLSNLPLAASLLPRANKVAFAVLRLVYTKQPPRSFRRCSPVTTPVHHKRVATALPHTMVPPFGSPPTAFPYKWKGLRQGAQPSGHHVWSFPQNTARSRTSALA